MSESLLAGEADLEWLDLDLDDFESLLADLDLDRDFEVLLLAALLGLELLRERDREFLLEPSPFVGSGDLDVDLDLDREPLRSDATDGDLDLWFPTNAEVFNSLWSIPSKKCIYIGVVTIIYLGY